MRAGHTLGIRWGAAAVALLALLCLCPAVRAEGEGPGSTEAARQVSFARSELRAGAYNAALRSAESALRLSPGLPEALYLKALAWEGLDDLALAETALLACIEQGCDADVPRVHEALERVRARRHDLEQAQRRGGPAMIRPAREVVRPGPGDLDAGPYRVRSQEALRQGRCSAAEVSAVELTRAAPDLPDGYRLLGDAARCEQRTRAAVLAYREYLGRGGDDPGVLELVDGLARSLATVHVTVRLDDPDVVPRLQMDLSGERVEPAFQNRAFGAATAGFVDLPTAAPLALVVAGLGLRAETLSLGALAASEQRKVEVTPAVVGLGTVTVGHHDPEVVRVTVRSPDQEIVVGPGQSRTVTAGELEVAVTTALGTVALPEEVPRRGTLRVDPADRMPAALTVRGLPAGSRVRVFVDRSQDLQIERTLHVPPEFGTIDRRTGIRVAPPQRIDSLLGGSAGVWVDHPLLGQHSIQQQLESDAENGSVFDPSKLPGIGPVTAAWEDWSQGSEALQKKRRAGSAASGILGALLLAGGGAAVGLAQVAANARIKPEVTWRLLEEAGQPYDRSRAEAESLARQQDALLWGGACAIGVGVGGVTISIGLANEARRADQDTGAWDPWAEVEER